MAHLPIEIVKHSDQVEGFVVVPKRWIVECTFAWLNRCRRLAKDWKTSTGKSDLPASRIYSVHAPAVVQKR